MQFSRVMLNDFLPPLMPDAFFERLLVLVLLEDTNWRYIGGIVFRIGPQVRHGRGMQSPTWTYR